MVVIGTKVPARTGEDGGPVAQWHYKVPAQIEDDWPVATLVDAGIAQQPSEALFQNVIEDKYQGLDAVLIAHNGSWCWKSIFILVIAIGCIASNL